MVFAYLFILSATQVNSSLNIYDHSVRPTSTQYHCIVCSIKLIYRTICKTSVKMYTLLYYIPIQNAEENIPISLLSHGKSSTRHYNDYIDK